MISWNLDWYWCRYWLSALLYDDAPSFLILLCAHIDGLSYFGNLYSVHPMHMQVQGVVQDRSGRTVATLFGKWDESMHYVMGDCFGKGKGSEQFSEAHLLWKRSKPPQFPTRYNLTRFAITLNELTPGLKVNIIVCIKLHLKIIFLCSGSFF